MGEFDIVSETPSRPPGEFDIVSQTPSSEPSIGEQALSVGKQVLDTALWTLRPFIAAGSFAQAPFAHEFKSDGFVNQVGEAFSVGADAALKDLFPKTGSKPVNYVGKALEGVDIPDALRPSVELALSVLTDPTIVVSGGFAKSLNKAVELAARTGEVQNPYANALKEFISVVPMSPAEALHFSATAKAADSGELKATQEMLDEFVILDRQKNAIEKATNGEGLKVEHVAHETPEIHPEVAVQSDASIKDVNNVVENIKAKKPKTLANANAMDGIDNIKIKARVNVMDVVKKERATAEKKIAVSARKEAKKIINEHPVYQFIEAIKDEGGISPQGLPEELIKVLKENHGLIKNGGKNAMQVAEKHGLQDPLKMVEGIAHVGSKKGAIKQVANALFKEDEKSLKGISDVDMQARFLEEEMKLMGVEMPPEAFKLLKEFEGNPSKELSDRIVAMLEGTKEKIGSSELKTLVRKNTGQVSVGKMISEEQALKAAWKKAEQASRIAFREGKKEATLIERVRFEAYRAAVKERKSINKSISILKKAQKHQGVPLDYMEQMQSVIGGLVPLAKKYTAHAPEKSLDEWLAIKADAGDKLFADSIMAMVDDLPQHRNISEMTADDLKKFADFARAMEYGGVTENKFMAFVSKQKISEAIDTGINQIRSIWGEQFSIPKANKLIEAKGRIERAYVNSSDKVRALLARNVRPKFIPIALDGEKLDGHFTNLLERPLLNAQREEASMLMDYKQRIEKAFSPFQKGFTKWHTSKTSFTLESGEVRVYDKQKQVMIALNAGSNKAELMHGYNFTEKDIENIINNLDDKELKLVQDIRDIFGSFYERSNEINIKLTNKRLPQLKYYFPIVQDTKLIEKSGGRKKIKELVDGNDERDLFSTITARSSNTKGSQRKLRKGGAGALKLDFSVIDNQVNHTIHDVTHALPVRDVQKILANKDLKDAIHEALGPNVHGQLVTSLQHVARPIREGMSIAERAAGTAKSLTTVAILGLNFNVGLKQTLSLSLSIREMGFTAVAKEVLKYWTNPIAFRRMMAAVDEMEPLIKARGMSLDRELQDLTKTLIPAKYRDMSFAWIRFNDRLAVYPTYMAAFNKEMKLHGDIDKAKKIALDMVEITQPTNHAKDLAATMRGTEYEKWAKSFMSFFSVLTNSLNRASRERKLLRLDGKQLAAAKNAARTYWWLLAAPAYLATSADKGRPATAKETVEGMISMRMAGHPIARVLWNGAFGDYGSQLNPTESTIRKMLGSTKDLDTKDAATILGFFAGVPTKPFLRFGEGMENIYQGRTDNILEPLMGQADQKDEFDFISGVNQ